MEHIALAWLLVLTILAVTQASKICTPDQWEGSLDRKSFVGPHSNEKLDLSRSFDYKNRKQATVVTNTVNDKVASKYHLLTLYEGSANNGTLYALDMLTNKCAISKIGKPFEKLCLPDDAKFTGDFHIGLAEHNALQVIDYSITFQGVKDTKITVTPVDDAFVPVFSYGHKSEYLQGTIFFGFSLGIKSQSVFDIPKPCQKGLTDFKIPEEVLLHHKYLGY